MTASRDSPSARPAAPPGLSIRSHAALLWGPRSTGRSPFRAPTRVGEKARRGAARVHGAPRMCRLSNVAFLLLVHVGPALGAPQAWSVSSDESCIFSLTLRNFRPILSWELKNRSIVPTHYTLWHTNMSEREVPLELVPECANITRPSCDLTHHWRSLAEMYLPRLVGSRGSATLVDCGGSIYPDVDMTLEPPEFEIVGFVDHINVILKFPPSLPKLPPGEGLWLHLSLSIEEESEGIVKKHLLKIDERTTGNFTYVIDKLIPNTSYCVSVYLRGNILSRSLRSPWKCTRLPPRQDSESSESAAVGGLVIPFLVAAVLGSVVTILKRVGYICLRSKFPKVLWRLHTRDEKVKKELRRQR